MNQSSENPYESPGEVVRAELVTPIKQPWPLWAKVTIVVCVVVFGPGGIAAIMFAILMLLRSLGVAATD